MPLITPIGATLQARALATTSQYIELAGQLFNRRFKEIPVQFTLHGRAAGMYHVSQGRRLIRYNPYLFAKYFDDNLQNTVPHEVAHYITDMLFGIKNIKPHGREWQDIMARFGIEARVRCQYDLDGIPQRRHRLHRYRCECREYDFTTRRHNMVDRGERLYKCRSCNTLITHTCDK